MPDNKEYGFFRRALAFLAMIFEFWVFGLVAELVIRFLGWCIGEISTLSGAFQAIIYIALGTTMLAIAIAPMLYGIPLMIAASESIAPSRNGARYVVFSVMNAVPCIIVLALYLITSGRFSLVYAYLAVAAIIIGICGKRV